jgi:hypothetical protein
MNKIIFQISLVAFLLFCIYLTTFAEIDFKELQNENLFIRIGYTIGLFVCAPVGLLLGLAPESWNPGVFISNLVIAAPSALAVIAVVFHRIILRFLKRARLG